MAQSARWKSAIPLLIIAVLAETGGWAATNGESAQTKAKPAIDHLVAHVATTANATIAETKIAPFVYDAKGRRDPFAPLVIEGRRVGMKAAASTTTTASGKPVLYGILWDPSGHSIAMVDDTEVKVGDAVGPYHVVDIREDAVVLKNGGEPLELRIEFDVPSSHPGASKGGEGR